MHISIHVMLHCTSQGRKFSSLDLYNGYLQVPLGIQIACSIRVGQYLGSGSALGAITAARLAVFVVCEYLEN